MMIIKLYSRKDKAASYIFEYMYKSISDKRYKELFDAIKSDRIRDGYEIKITQEDK